MIHITDQECKNSDTNNLTNRINHCLQPIKIEYNVEQTVCFTEKENVDKYKYNSVKQENQFIEQIKMESNMKINNSIAKNDKYIYDISCNTSNQFIDQVKMEDTGTIKQISFCDKDTDNGKNNLVHQMNQSMKIIKEYNREDSKNSDQDMDLILECIKIEPPDDDDDDQLSEPFEQFFHCSMCNFETNSKRKLTAHSKVNHSEGGQKNYKKYIKSNVISTWGKLNLKCKSKNNLKNNFISHLKNNCKSKRSHNDLNKLEEWPIDLNCETVQIGDLIQSKRSGEKKLHCPNCNYKTNHNGNFIKHKWKHLPNKERKFHCSECDYKTNQKSNLNTHKMKHQPNNIFYLCDECDYKATSKGNLVRHKLRHLPDEEKKFHCTECDFKTHQKCNLTTHKMRHLPHEARRFSCPECDYKTNRRGNLILHNARHSIAEKIFHCSECEYKTSRRCNLIRHNIRHQPNIEKTIYCIECDYRTNCKSSLITHKKIHLPNAGRILHCTECDYTTNQKSNLNTHKLLHLPNQDKKFQCTECGYKTQYKGNLKLHNRKHIPK